MTQADLDLVAAVKIFDRKQVEKAISSGGNVNGTDPMGMTPLHWLCTLASGQVKIAQGNIRSHVSHSNVLDIFDLLLSKGANPNAQSAKDALTPLHVLLLDAVPFAGIEPIVSKLLKAGADINAKSSGGLTPLTVAKTAQEVAKSNDFTTVASLKELGAV
jgi:ankyrin repeat protein